jgi:ribulose-5-phosphate 4-epimerase/fuculose-1-phosphate aldolase
MTGTATAPTDQRPLPDERTHRRQALAAALRLFARFGLCEGATGHLSARDPERPDHCWMNAADQHWALIRASDLILVGPGGVVVEGRGPVNPAGVALHAQLLAARPDAVAVAVVHAHSVAGKAWSVLRRPLDPITQDACAFFGDHVVVPFTGIALDPREGQHISDVLGPRKAAILANHGLLTVGGSVEKTAWWFISLDRQCKVQLLAEAAGGPMHMIDPDTAAATATVNGSPEVGRLQFSLLWQLITAAVFTIASCGPDLNSYLG